MVLQYLEFGLSYEICTLIYFSGRKNQMNIYIKILGKTKTVMHYMLNNELLWCSFTLHNFIKI